MSGVVDQPTGGELPDVDGVPIADLQASTDDALANALYRLRREAERPSEALSAFSSFISSADIP